MSSYVRTVYVRMYVRMYVHKLNTHAFICTYVYNHMYTSYCQCSSDCLKVLEPSKGTSSAQQTSSSSTTAPITTAPITTASQPSSTPVTGM